MTFSVCSAPAPALAPLSSDERSRGCDKRLLRYNCVLADGCPCNSPRGINHGIVPTEVCTCPVCDPAQTGTSRAGIRTG